MSGISAEAKAFAEKALQLHDRFVHVTGEVRVATMRSQWEKARYLLGVAGELVGEMERTEQEAHEAMLREAERIVHPDRPPGVPCGMNQLERKESPS